MGTLIIRLIDADPDLSLAAALEAPGHADLGRDAGQLAGLGKDLGVKLTSSLEADSDVLIDFSLPAGTLGVIDACIARKTPMIIGTTGIDEAGVRKIESAAKKVPVVFAPNMSVGVNLLFKLVGQVAAALGDDYDIEITETHHRFKKDAPSGTALGLAKSICDATGKDLVSTLVHGRSGACPRQAGEIGMHALRVGDTVGEHGVHLGNLGETVTLSHSAHTRDTFVRGALRAAAWVAGREAGLYSMQDVLFG